MAMQPTQVQNPNQAAGANMLPMSYAPPPSAIVSTAPGTVGSEGSTGPGASTYGQPFGGLPTTLPSSPTSGMPSISSGLSTQDGSNTLVGDFSDTYGKGTGTALAGILANLGTSTNSAVQATNANVLNAANNQYANILGQEAATGISPDSSSHALTAGDFNAQVNSNLASVDANMETQGLNTLISALQGEGSAHGPDGSALDTLGNVLGLAGGAAGAASEAFGIGGTTGSALDFLGML